MLGDMEECVGVRHVGEEAEPYTNYCLFHMVPSRYGIGPK